jgi:hypothetical protein
MKLRAILALSLGLAACTTRESHPVTTRPAVDDPRTAVTAWSQVARFHCARGADGSPGHCATDGDCADGRVCDTSAGCGCCVPPPPPVEPGVALRRYMFTPCLAGRCAPPRFCEPAADGTTCTMRFNGQVRLWMSTWVPPERGDALAETRRELCILVEPGQDCMWAMEIPGGEYDAEAPMPVHYDGSYECGGRTCNGARAVRATPRAGSTYTAHLVTQRCGG